MALTLTKAVVIRGLRALVESGEVTKSEVMTMFQEGGKTRKIVPREILDAAAEQSRQHMLVDDGYRFGVQIRSGGYVLILVVKDGPRRGHAAAPRLGARFTGRDDIAGAAEMVLKKFVDQMGEG
jgi:hypothetical protein